MKRLRYLGSKFGSGVTPRGGATVYRASGVPFLRSQNVHFDGLRLDGVAYIAQETHDSLPGTHLRPNDILLNITGASIGRVCTVPLNFQEGNVNQHVCIIRPKTSSVNPAFLAAFLSTDIIQREIRSEQNGASREGLTLASIRSMIILLPPLNIQQDICNFIDAEAREIKAASQLVEREITLIQDFRTRMIADVVTGKLDVRALAASLPETAGQEAPLDPSDDEDLDDLPDDLEPEEAAA